MNTWMGSSAATSEMPVRAYGLPATEGRRGDLRWPAFARRHGLDPAPPVQWEGASNGTSCSAWSLPPSPPTSIARCSPGRSARDEAQRRAPAGFPVVWGPAGACPPLPVGQGVRSGRRRRLGIGYGNGLLSRSRVMVPSASGKGMSGATLTMPATAASNLLSVARRGALKRRTARRVRARNRASIRWWRVCGGRVAWTGQGWVQTGAGR